MTAAGALAALEPITAGVAVWLAGGVPDPEDVKPGWLGFAVFLALAAAVVFLAFSFRKQLRKVTFDEDRTDVPPDVVGPERGVRPQPPPTSPPDPGGPEPHPGGSDPDRP